MCVQSFGRIELSESSAIKFGLTGGRFAADQVPLTAMNLYIYGICCSCKFALSYLIHLVFLASDCSPRCTARCSATAYKKPCMFFCQKCCAKCLCVPPGTYGNKQTCPCYNNWKTKRGGPKCPWSSSKSTLTHFDSAKLTQPEGHWVYQVRQVR